ncbi:hypothetical protein K1719_019883 [Acacia pycnantha]|nr:hypothetical protein K1719_019883 [Acacia pycnantha]
MAKQQESKKNILKILLQKAVTAGVLAFQNHQLVVQKNHKNDGPKGSIEMVPEEARRRSEHGGSGNNHLEPTSPNVSCMGQIKCKKHQCQYQRRIKKAKSKLIRNVSDSEVISKKETSLFQRTFRWMRGRESSRASSEVHGESAVAATPALSQMKRLESRRSALANFDWKANVVAPEEDEDDETIISFTEPIIMALRPKREINLWKRRNIAPPPPLTLNPI